MVGSHEVCSRPKSPIEQMMRGSRASGSDSSSRMDSRSSSRNPVTRLANSSSVHSRTKMPVERIGRHAPKGILVDVVERPAEAGQVEQRHLPSPHSPPTLSSRVYVRYRAPRFGPSWPPILRPSFTMWLTPLRDEFVVALVARLRRSFQLAFGSSQNLGLRLGHASSGIRVHVCQCIVTLAGTYEEQYAVRSSRQSVLPGRVHYIGKLRDHAPQCWDRPPLRSSRSATLGWTDRPRRRPLRPGCQPSHCRGRASSAFSLSWSIPASSSKKASSAPTTSAFSERRVFTRPRSLIMRSTPSAGRNE